MSQENISRTILSLHPHKAAQVLRKLDEGTLIAVGEAVLKHGGSSKPAKAGYTGTAFTKETEPYNSSLEIVKALYRVAFGVEKSQELVKKILRKKIQRKLDFLRVYKDDEVLQAVQNEPPAVISIVLSAMDAKSAARVLTMLSRDTRAAVISNIAKQQSPAMGIVDIIEQTLKKRLHELTAREKFDTTAGGVEGLSSILQYMDVEAQNVLIADLGDNALASRLEDRLFSWQQCFDMPRKHMGEILENFSLYELAKIVVLCGEAAHKAIAYGLSERNKALLEDEVEMCYKDPTAKLNTAQLKLRLCNAVREATEKYAGVHTAEALL